MYSRRKKICVPSLRRTTPQHDSHSLYTNRYVHNVANPNARKSRSVADATPPLNASSHQRRPQHHHNNGASNGNNNGGGTLPDEHHPHAGGGGGGAPHSDRIDRISYVMETDFDYTDHDVPGPSLAAPKQQQQQQQQHHVVCKHQSSNAKRNPTTSAALSDCGVQVMSITDTTMVNNNTTATAVVTHQKPGGGGGSGAVHDECVPKGGGGVKKRDSERFGVFDNNCSGSNELTDIKKSVNCLKKSFDKFREATVTNKEIDLDRQESVEFQFHDRLNVVNDMCRDILRREDENRHILDDIKSELMRLNVRFEERERVQSEKFNSVTNDISEIRQMHRNAEYRRGYKAQQPRDSSSVVLNVNIQAGLADKKVSPIEITSSTDEMKTIYQSGNIKEKLESLLDDTRTTTTAEPAADAESRGTDKSRLDVTDEQSDTSTQSRRPWRNLFRRISQTVLAEHSKTKKMVY